MKTPREEKLEKALKICRQRLRKEKQKTKYQQDRWGKHKEERALFKKKNGISPPVNRQSIGRAFTKNDNLKCTP